MKFLFSFRDTNIYEVRDGNRNRFGSFMSYFRTHTIEESNNKRFIVDYVNSANVIGPQYKLGMYVFNIENKHPHYVDVMVDTTSVAIQSVTPGTPSQSSLELSGRDANGYPQKLVFKGEKVDQIEQNTFRIFVNAHQQGSL